MILNETQREQWQEKGYLLLEGLYSEAEIDQVNGLVDKLWKQRHRLDDQYVIDVFVGTEKEKRVFFADASTEARKQPYKLNDLFLTQEQIRETIAGERLGQYLRELLDGFPLVCNTLNFEFGSQQPYHFDTFYMPSPTPNKMVASWIALEDATEQNGPLSYYPGSHKIPPYHFSNGSTIVEVPELPQFRDYIFSELQARGIEPETLIAKKGDVLIWHSQLFHGGSPILDKSQTRKSLVTHYFTKEDFPDLNPPHICSNGAWINRSAQPVPYEFKPKSWWQRTFGTRG